MGELEFKDKSFLPEKRLICSVLSKPVQLMHVTDGGLGEGPLPRRWAYFVIFQPKK